MLGHRLFAAQKTCRHPLIRLSEAISWRRSQAIDEKLSTMSTYVRPASFPDETEQVIDIYVRAFARDPLTNYWGSVKSLVSHHDIRTLSKDSQDYRVLKRLRVFELILLRQTLLSGGTVYVVAEKTDDGEEKIVGAAGWMPPGSSLDPTLSTMIRLKSWKILFRWGLKGVYRIVGELTPNAEKAKKKAFKAHGLDRSDSWHLFTIVVDPDSQGKGYGSLLLRDGLARVSSKPVHLEASNEGAMMLYQRHGFEVGEVHRYGAGKVDANGVKAKGEKAVGVSVWMMYKWK